MKKFYLIMVAFAFIIILFSEKGANVNSSGGSERFNDSESMNAAREIATINGVTEVAVLQRSGRIIAGILSEGDAHLTKMSAEKILKKRFPNAVSRAAFVEDDEALDIIELSYYIDSGVERKILKKRFNYLVGKKGK